MPQLVVPSRSLSHAAARTPVVVRRIPYETVRVLCAESGLGEGDVVSVDAQYHENLFLRSADGRRIVLDEALADSVEVDAALPVARVG